MPVYNSMIPEVIKMVSGTLALKNGYYYAVLSYRDAAGKTPSKMGIDRIAPKRE